MNKEVLIFSAMLLPWLVSAQQLRSLSPDIERRIDSLLQIMTIEEKLGQLNQVGPRWNSETEEPERSYQGDLVRRGRIGSFLYLVGAEATRKVQRIAVEESRLKIPLLFGHDVIHGFKTTFPIPLALSCSWNPELVESTARVAAVEATAGGINWTFAPMVDIARDPRWGRIAEGAGEDPYLGSVMAEAQVRGFQGTDLRQRDALLACAKHFAVYGGAESGRDYNTVDFSERTIRDVYLPPFKAAVEAGVGTLMSAFNEIGGVPSTGSKWLMTDVLREEWKFNGFVVSDYAAVEQLMNHGVASSREEAGVLALNAGMDMDMVDTIYTSELIATAKAGKLNIKAVDESVRRVLRVKFAIGLFDDPYRNCDTTIAAPVFMKKEHHALARRAAQESIVLLKNEKGILPLAKKLKTIAVLGPLADNRIEWCGPWAGRVEEGNFTSVLDAVRSKVESGTEVLFDKGCEVIGDSGYNPSLAVGFAKQSQVAVVVVGENANMSGEAASRSNIDLPGKQKDLVKAICETGTPVVLVLMNGRPLTIAWEAEHVAAIVEAWFLGVGSGNAVADVLFGDSNPSGKLSVTFPRIIGQIPIYYNHKNTGRPIREADKFTSKYLDVSNTPLYPFGFGLSYTTFEYSNLRLSSPEISMNQELMVRVDVTNTGKRDGDEIVQLYVRDNVGSVTRPVRELKGFEKTGLKAGEKKTVGFTLRPEDLAFHNIEMKQAAEPGKFTVYVGGSSVDGLETEFELK
ncbi:MAG TPA: glycoside hydrolase family 3 N-terminal domain-containing protein [Bacteroidota bacterium]